MCRKNQLCGCAVMAFGVGVLLGLWIEGGFFAHCFGIGMLLLGFCIGRKK